MTIVFAQSPEKMSYQAVIRNSNNVLVSNTQVGMKISILKGSADGTEIYTEIQTPTTNGNGLVSIEIGGGTGFNTINWANGIYFIKTETDLTGGINYTISGASQILSVPYALHSKTAESITGTITESDPIFGESLAKSISISDTANWNNKSDFSGDYFDLKGKPFTYDKNSNVQSVFYNNGNVLRFGQPKWDYQPYNYQISIGTDTLNKFPGNIAGGILIVGHDTNTIGNAEVPLEIIGEIKNTVYGFNTGESQGRLIKLRRSDRNENLSYGKSHFIGITEKDELYIGEGANSARVILDNGRVGIGVDSPKTMLHLSSGELYIENGGTVATQSGIILKTPDNTKCYKLTIDNNGNLVTTLVDCPE